jgi:hypothetical protein
MGMTNQRGYPFPDDTDEVDVPSDVRALAEKVESDVVAITADTGWTDINTTQNGNWAATQDGARYRRKGGVVFIALNYMPAAYPDEAILFTLPLGFRPKYLQISQSRYDKVNVEISINTNGQVRVTEPTTSGIAFSAQFPVD